MGMARLGPVADAVRSRLLEAIAAEPASVIRDGMAYACQGGKGLRGFLVVESARLHGVAGAEQAGAAVEALHAYSLVHDDLPSMDDDDLRRGQPTVHVKWDEATAVLVGDALQTLAFRLLADPGASADPAVRADLVLSLAEASGAGGMVLGQAQDIAAETRRCGPLGGSARAPADKVRSAAAPGPRFPSSGGLAVPDPVNGTGRGRSVPMFRLRKQPGGLAIKDACAGEAPDDASAKVTPSVRLSAGPPRRAAGRDPTRGRCGGAALLSPGAGGSGMPLALLKLTSQSNLRDATQSCRSAATSRIPECDTSRTAKRIWGTIHVQNAFRRRGSLVPSRQPALRRAVRNGQSSRHPGAAAGGTARQPGAFGTGAGRRRPARRAGALPGGPPGQSRRCRCPGGGDARADGSGRRGGRGGAGLRLRRAAVLRRRKRARPHHPGRDRGITITPKTRRSASWRRRISSAPG